MDDAIKHLLDQINKSLEDSRALGRMGVATIITFGTAALIARSQGRELVCGQISVQFFGFFMIAATGLWVLTLSVNLWQQQKIGKALQQMNSPEAEGVLATNVHWSHRIWLFAARLAVVLFLVANVWWQVGDYDTPTACPAQSLPPS